EISNSCSAARFMYTARPCPSSSTTAVARRSRPASPDSRLCRPSARQGIDLAPDRRDIGLRPIDVGLESLDPVEILLVVALVAQAIGFAALVLGLEGSQPLFFLAQFTLEDLAALFITGPLGRGVDLGEIRLRLGALRRCRCRCRNRGQVGQVDLAAVLALAPRLRIAVLDHAIGVLAAPDL